MHWHWRQMLGQSRLRDFRTMPRPNILLILCDELRADALGCFGNPIVQTPNIDRLANQGTLFEQCMITQPTCTPSRASILTGCYPSTLRSRMVGCYTPPDSRFLPQVLADEGYCTVSIGKIHLVPQAAEPDALAERMVSEDSTYYGFQEVDLVNGHGDRCFGPHYSPWLQERVPDIGERRQQREPITPGVDTFRWTLPPEVHPSHYIATRVEEFLASAATQPACEKQPFFLHVSFPDPHYPFIVPEPYASMYAPAEMPPPLPPVTESHGMPELHQSVHFHRNATLTRADGRPVDRIIGTPPHDYSRYGVADWQQVKATYYGMTSLVDASVGRILAALAQHGLRENTIIIFLSDHGDYLGDHGFYGKGLPYDSVLRTPLICAGPGIGPAQRITSMATTLDIAPTLLDMAQIAEPEGVQGASMASMLQGIRAGQRTAVMTENDDDFVPMRMRTVTTNRWKLTYYLDHEMGELIDRKNDPNELVNLWHDPQHVEIKQELMKMLLDMILRSIDTSNGRRQPPGPPVPKW